MKIKKILVPTDFSEHAAVAYTHAQEIAGKFGATIDFVHIIPTLKYFNESYARLGVPLDMESDLYPTAQKEAQHQLQEMMNDYINDESRGKAIAKIDRKPSTRIAQIATEGEYDLIVMASKGHHNSELLRGSTTEKVIRHSDVPVFTIDQRLSAEGLKRILLPTDGSAVSFAALPMALTFAETYEAEITLLHVVEMYGSPLSEHEHDPLRTDEANRYEILIDRLEDYLIEDNLDDVQIARGEVDFEDQFIITDDASGNSINFYTVLEKGVSAHFNIAEYAAEHADIVVMATHGYSGLAHFFLGSTTEKVAQHLDLPVVTVKPQIKKLEKKD
jgi:nucleotide-binding universal stress UspA family protein